jgi:hypothetical protein
MLQERSNNYQDPTGQEYICASLLDVSSAKKFKG